MGSTLLVWGRVVLWAQIGRKSVNYREDKAVLAVKGLQLNNNVLTSRGYASSIFR